jgi:hypothetical protein
MDAVAAGPAPPRQAARTPTLSRGGPSFTQLSLWSRLHTFMTAARIEGLYAPANGAKGERACEDALPSE